MPARRTVLRTMAGTGILIAAASYRRVLGANERVWVRLVGNGFLATLSNREVAASGGGGLEFHRTKALLKLNRAEASRLLTKACPSPWDRECRGALLHA